MEPTTESTASLEARMLLDTAVENHRRARIAHAATRIGWSAFGALVGSLATWGWIVVLGVMR